MWKDRILLEGLFSEIIAEMSLIGRKKGILMYREHIELLTDMNKMDLSQGILSTVKPSEVSKIYTRELPDYDRM